MFKLKVSDRDYRKPIKKLPKWVDVPLDATVENVKTIIAREAGFSDFNRIGLIDPTTKQILKNRRSLIRDEAGVQAAGEVVVKDLGAFLPTFLPSILPPSHPQQQQQQQPTNPPPPSQAPKSPGAPSS